MRKRRSQTLTTRINRSVVLKAIAALLAVAGAYYSPYGPTHSKADNPDSPTPNTSEKLYTGTVIKVHDGDTINVRDTHGHIHKIRFHAVDAPELKQRHGTTAQAWLSEQILQKPIKISVITKDRYQREVAKVLRPAAECPDTTVCDNDEDINLQLLQHGHVWWYKDYAKEQTKADRALYSDAEKDAKSNKLGLWEDKNPTPPWLWRKERRQEQGKE